MPSEADKDLLKKQLGDVAKLKGNGFYGKMTEIWAMTRAGNLHVKKWLLTRPLGLRFLTI